MPVFELRAEVSSVLLVNVCDGMDDGLPNERRQYQQGVNDCTVTESTGMIVSVSGSGSVDCG